MPASKHFASVLLAAALAGAGCSQLFPPDSRQEAGQRWNTVRAKLKYQLALESFESGQLDEARRRLDESLSLDPAFGEALVLQAKILLEKGETAAASEALDEAIRQGADTAETDYLSGIIAQRYRKPGDALAWYQRAAQREPTSAPYVVAVAETLVSLQRTAEALELVNARLTDFEQNATLRALAGSIYTLLGDHAKAADAYRDAARIAPEDARLRAQLGMALSRAGKYQEARPVLASASGSAEAEVSLLVELGRCRLALSEPEEAKAVLRRAVDAEPGNARNWALLAQACIASRDLLTARRAAQQAAQLAPDSDEYRLCLGYVCWAQKDYRSAVSVLEPLTRGGRAASGPKAGDEAVTEFRPESPGRAAATQSMALYLLAECYRSMGSVDRARACAERMLQADPECAWARAFAAPEQR